MLSLSSAMALIVLPFERIDNAAAAQVEQPVHVCIRRATVRRSHRGTGHCCGNIARCSSSRFPITTSGTNSQGSKIRLGSRRTQAALRPCAFAPMTSNGLPETSQAFRSEEHTSELQSHSDL